MVQKRAKRGDNSDRKSTSRGLAPVNNKALLTQTAKFNESSGLGHSQASDVQSFGVPQDPTAYGVGFDR